MTKLTGIGVTKLRLSTTGKLLGNVAIPVSGVVPGDRTLIYDKAVSAYLVSDAEIQSGKFKLDSGYDFVSLPVTLAGSNDKIDDLNMIPVYLVSGSLGASVPWYLSGGIPQSQCVAAYAPKGASSYAASKINLVSPGVHNAVDGTAAPTWSASAGWTGNGSSQFLTTDIVPDGDYCFVVKYSGATNTGAILGVVVTTPSTNRFTIQAGLNGIVYSKGTSQSTVLPVMNTGIAGISGLNGYRLGCLDVAIGGGWGAPMQAIYLLCRNLGGTANSFFAGNIEYVAIYNFPLTNTQMLAVAVALNSDLALNKNNYNIVDSSGNGFNGKGYSIRAGGSSGRARFDGVYSFANIYSAGLAAAFNGLEGSLMMRAKVNSATDWSDAVQRDPIRIDGSTPPTEHSIAAFDRTPNADEVRCYYQTDSGAYFGVTTTELNGTLDWFTAAVTWSRSNTRVRGYANGVQQGSDVALTADWIGGMGNNAGFGTAHPTASAPDYLWGGHLGPVLLASRELTALEVESLNETFTLANAQSILGANLLGWWELNES